MRTMSEAAARRSLCLPEGYRVREINGRLYLFDPDGVPLAGPADAETIDQRAWRDVWRRIDDELREEMAALRDGNRPIHSLTRVRQYLRMVDAISRQQVSEPAPAAARPLSHRALRWGVLFASAAAAAAVVAGPQSVDRGPQVQAPVTAPPGQARPVLAGRPKVPAAGPPRSAPPVQAPSRRAPARAAGTPRPPAHGIARSPQPAPPPGYGVVVAVLPDPAAADRVMHAVRSKGYVVDVVARGGAAQVATPAYRTREQAERVARGLHAIGMPAQVITMRGR